MPPETLGQAAVAILLAALPIIGYLAGALHGQIARNRDYRELANLKLDRERPQASVYTRNEAGELVPVDDDPRDEPILRDAEREKMVEDVMEGSTLTLEEARAHVDELLRQATSSGFGA